MKSVKGYSLLSEEQKELFHEIHKRHLAGMGTEKRKQYEESNLKEIKWDRKEKCLKVYWHGETDWFHYTTRGAWY